MFVARAASAGQRYKNFYYERKGITSGVLSLSLYFCFLAALALIKIFISKSSNESARTLTFASNLLSHALASYDSPAHFHV